MPLPNDRQMLDYIPAFLQSYYKPIVDAEQPEFEQSWQNNNDFLANAYLFTAGETGIARLEKLFKVTPKATDTLDDRRFRVQSLLTGGGAITVLSMLKKLDKLMTDDEPYADAALIDKWNRASVKNLITNGTLLTFTGYGNASTKKIDLITGHKYYTRRIYNSISGTPKPGISGSIRSLSPSMTYLIDAYKYISSVFTMNGATRLQTILYFYGNNPVGEVKFENVIVLDLTETFGAGNEPSKEEMDKILAYYPNSFFDGEAAKIGAKNSYTFKLEPNLYKLSVRVGLSVKSQFDTVKELLENEVPANLIVDVLLRFNTHQTLIPYTHAQLASYTHAQLRNEVLNG